MKTKHKFKAVVLKRNAIMNASGGLLFRTQSRHNSVQLTGRALLVVTLLMPTELLVCLYLCLRAKLECSDEISWPWKVKGN